MATRPRVAAQSTRLRVEQPGAGTASGEPWPKTEHELQPRLCMDLHTLYSTCRITWIWEKYRNLLQEKIFVISLLPVQGFTWSSFKNILEKTVAALVPEIHRLMLKLASN